MLRSILVSAIKSIKENNATVQDICSIDVDIENPDKTVIRPVSVWKFNKFIGKNVLVVGNHHPLRRIAKSLGCEAVQIMWGETELTIRADHQMFYSKKDIIHFLQQLNDTYLFVLKSKGEYYLTDKFLNFGFEHVWLRFRGDFSSKDKPMFALKGSLEMAPSKHNRYQVVIWSERDQDFLYNQHLAVDDITVVEEAEVIAERL